MKEQDVACIGQMPVCSRCDCSKPHKRMRYTINTWWPGESDEDIQQYCTQWQECWETDTKVRCLKVREAKQ